jgi:porphobilinogen synthase
MVTPVTNASFPNIRMRRLRQTDWVRRMVRETRLSPDDLVWSIIVHDGDEARIPVAAMPGVDRLNVAEAAKVAKEGRALGIPAIAMFPHVSPAKKDPTGKEGLNPDNIVCRAVKAMKDAAPEVGLICDVALDPFTDHGHDGLIEDGRILNDPTIDSLIQQALIQARAGCDVIAPSDMMDGRIGAVRKALEADGLQDTMILSYAAKYASAFYGPYREAIGSAAALKGDKKTYQMDYGNSDEALREVALDLAEGADMVMVKPGLPYLDIIRRIHDEFAVPTFAFQVSGEYAMMKAAAANGWLDENRAILETLGAFKRAGCAGIITYAAPQAARLMGA